MPRTAPWSSSRIGKCRKPPSCIFCSAAMGDAPLSSVSGFGVATSATNNDSGDRPFATTRVTRSFGVKIDATFSRRRVWPSSSLTTVVRTALRVSFIFSAASLTVAPRGTTQSDRSAESRAPMVSLEALPLSESRSWVRPLIFVEDRAALSLASASAFSSFSLVFRRWSRSNFSMASCRHLRMCSTANESSDSSTGRCRSRRVTIVRNASTAASSAVTDGDSRTMSVTFDAAQLVLKEFPPPTA
mmetsp:Transcript_5003/g.16404  ORF Transcript_5003/g.16404 Transcript_5003/m.16404 type:complete len:244 (+) Transcript_5003:1316-2047(+)